MRGPRTLASFSFLLVMLAATIVVSPMLERQLEHMAGARLFVTGIYLAGLAAVSGQRRVLWIGSALALAALGSEWLTLFTGRLEYQVLDAVSSMAFYVFVGGVILHTVVSRPEVTVDTLLGGLCVYLLVGLLFVDVYRLLELFHPGSFRIGGELLTLRSSDPGFSPQLLYFSFVTLTTLGYGDVTPLSAPARSLAIVEAVTGQLYLAVFIAGLLGRHLAARVRG